MKTRRLYAYLASGCLPAVLLVAQLSAGHAFAQTAPAPGDDDTPLRLDQPLTNSSTDRNSRDNSKDPSQDSTDSTDAQDQDPDTATVTDPDADPDADKNATEEAATLKELRRQNLREESADNLRPAKIEDEELTPGISVGTFTLRPALSESLGMERTKTGKDAVNRAYLQTGLKGSLTSNWALHQLKIDTEGTWQKTFSGIPQDDPEGKIEANLRLDISEVTKINLRAGYALQREDISAANAIANATNQAQVSTYTASAEVTHDLGVIRGTAGIDFERQTYGDAQLDTGKFVSQKDRNENTATLRGRLGYELSEALIPFRDAQLYAIKTGIQADFGEKLRGEISTGYALAEFDDPRLKSISAITLDGKANWSPQRGTDVELGLKTEIEPSTTAGASGDVAYTANAALTQAIIDTLKGNLTASTTWRDYSPSTQANQTVYDLGAGVTWGLSRSLDFNANVSWEKTVQSGNPESSIFTAGIGLTLKR